MAVDPGPRHQYDGVGNHRLACIPEVISVGGETAPQLSTFEALSHRFGSDARLPPAIRCNLYSITTNKKTIRALFRVIIGHLRPMPACFPDYPAPCIRST